MMSENPSLTMPALRRSYTTFEKSIREALHKFYCRSVMHPATVGSAVKQGNFQPRLSKRNEAQHSFFRQVLTDPTQAVEIKTDKEFRTQLLVHIASVNTVCELEPMSFRALSLCRASQPLEKERTMPDYYTGQLCTPLTTSTHLVVGPSLFPNPSAKRSFEMMSGVLWAQNSGRLLASLRVELSTSTVEIHRYATRKHTIERKTQKEKAQDFEPVRQHVVRAMKCGGGHSQPTFHHRPIPW